jgi:hypothetical protein
MPLPLNLQSFTLAELAQFTFEKQYSANASPDVHLFYVGRDNVHDLIVYILSRVNASLYLNMYGYDDAALNQIIMQKVMNPGITVFITLDSSQAGSQTEKLLLAADQKQSLSSFNTHFVIGKSSTGQISHTKGFTADGKVAAEGSTNWSRGGEGTFVLPSQPGGTGYIAQNNTQSVITDPDTISSFTTELIREHMAAQKQATSDPTMASSLKTHPRGEIAADLPAKRKPSTR